MKQLTQYAIVIILSLLLIGIGLWLFLGPKVEPTVRLGSSRVELVLLDDVDQNERLLPKQDVYYELMRLGIIPSTDSLWTSLEPHKIKSLLSSNTLYRSVAVFRHSSSQDIVIELEQRQPLFIVHPSTQMGSPYIVCSDRSIAPLPAQYTPYLPLVSGILSQQYAGGALYDLMKILDEQEEWHQYFDHVYVDPKEGVILSPRLYNTAIYIGKDGDWQARLHKLRVFEEQVLLKYGMQAYHSLKLQFGDQVVAQSTKTPNT